MEKGALETYIKRAISLAPDRLRHYIVDVRGKPLFYRCIFYRIQKLLNDFLSKRSENRWILLPGLRGTGKTTLLAQTYFYLLNKGISQTDIVYVSLDEVTKILGANLNDVISVYEALIGENLESIDRNIFLLVDEVHYDKSWAIALKSVFDRTKNVFIIATGSSSLSLQTSSDVARRAQVERVFPLTFSEYVMLKYRQKPVRSLRERIENAIFFSKDAAEVFARLKKVENVVNEYWNVIKPFELESFLKIGTLPIAISLSREEDVYRRVIAMLEKVINEDITTLKAFNRETLNKIWNLLLLFSVSKRVSYDSLCNQLGISKPTLSEIIDILTKAEIIYPLRPYGSVGRIVRKTPKYKFVAPAIKTSLLWYVGKIASTSELYGELLEDAVSMYLYKMSEIKRSFGFYYDAKKGGADFIVCMNDGSKIIIEVGYGQKGIKQIRKSKEKIEPKYSLVISEKKLEINSEEDVVFVPKRAFLLM